MPASARMAPAPAWPRIAPAWARRSVSGSAWPTVLLILGAGIASAFQVGKVPVVIADIQQSLAVDLSRHRGCCPLLRWSARCSGVTSASVWMRGERAARHWRGLPTPGTLLRPGRTGAVDRLADRAARDRGCRLPRRGGGRTGGVYCRRPRRTKLAGQCVRRLGNVHAARDGGDDVDRTLDRRKPAGAVSGRPMAALLLAYVVISGDRHASRRTWFAGNARRAARVASGLEQIASRPTRSADRVARSADRHAHGDRTTGAMADRSAVRAFHRHVLLGLRLPAVDPGATHLAMTSGDARACSPRWSSS